MGSAIWVSAAGISPYRNHANRGAPLSPSPETTPTPAEEVASMTASLKRFPRSSPRCFMHPIPSMETCLHALSSLAKEQGGETKRTPETCLVTWYLILDIVLPSKGGKGEGPPKRMMAAALVLRRRGYCPSIPISQGETVCTPCGSVVAGQKKKIRSHLHTVACVGTLHCASTLPFFFFCSRGFFLLVSVLSPSRKLFRPPSPSAKRWDALDDL